MLDEQEKPQKHPQGTAKFLQAALDNLNDRQMKIRMEQGQIPGLIKED